jgi:hypothetical protein
VCRIIATSYELAKLPGLERLERWTHMLDFRGHAFTKSRRFSTTFGALRRAQAEYKRRTEREAQGLPDDHDDDTTLVVNLIDADKDYSTTCEPLRTGTAHDTHHRIEPAHLTGPSPRPARSVPPDHHSA